jgi:NAD(P)-dependent dehydrogenase (short-subunit alcohol dehydrogenase family)
MSTRSPVALIVGMGPGLSAALAERFGAGGYAIAGFSRQPGKSDAIVARVQQRGRDMVMHAVDASDFASLAGTIADIETTTGPIEVLIYNAYRASYALPSSVPPDELMADIRVNVGGALAAVQAVLPAMRRRGRGSILLTGGGLALDPTGWLEASSLAVGKAGLRSLAYTLNKELTGTGLRVSTVTVAGPIAAGTGFAPELIAEAFWQLHVAEGEAPAEIIYRGPPVGEARQPERT